MRERRGDRGRRERSPRGLPPVAADPDKLRQILTNLIDNAIKYSPDGGRVEVEIGRSGGRVRFRVSDQGLGIPPAEQDRIFEKFFRLDPNLTRGVGGTGLGLYISRELVDADERPHLGRLRRPHRLVVLPRAADRMRGAGGRPRSPRRRRCVLLSKAEVRLGPAGALVVIRRPAPAGVAGAGPRGPEDQRQQDSDDPDDQQDPADRVDVDAGDVVFTAKASTAPTAARISPTPRPMHSSFGWGPGVQRTRAGSGFGRRLPFV